MARKGKGASSPKTALATALKRAANKHKVPAARAAAQTLERATHKSQQEPEKEVADDNTRPESDLKQVSRLAKEYGIRVISPQTPHKSSSQRRRRAKHKRSKIRSCTPPRSRNLRQSVYNQAFTDAGQTLPWQETSRQSGSSRFCLTLLQTSLGSSISLDPKQIHTMRTRRCLTPTAICNG